MKIKCGDIIFCPYVEDANFNEVGPGKMRDSGNVFYEIFPLVPVDDYFVYGDSCWIPKKAVAEHYTVRSNEDFHHAWISLGFQPIVSENDIRFEKLFDHEHITDEYYVDSLSSSSETESEIRSNDSWSTNDSDSEYDSFVDDSEVVNHCCCGENCQTCQERQDTERWFRRDWYPTDPTENAVKTIIERIEQKYT